MVGDWDKQLVHKKLLRLISKGLDALLKLIFKDENDWVIGCSEQRLKLTGPNVKPAADFEYKSVHGKYFVKDYPMQNNQHIDIFKIIEDYLAN